MHHLIKKEKYDRIYTGSNHNLHFILIRFIRNVYSCWCND
nr:MAG TPA: hypothetical protein [Caudoviricetes sp.]